MNNEHKARATDLELLSHLNAFSWLSGSDKSSLVTALEIANFSKREVILRESELASNANILLAGTASITCLNVRSERVMVALLPPGPIPEFPTFPFTPSRFQIEAYDDCRVGSLGWEQFDNLTSHSSQSASAGFIKAIFSNGIGCSCVARASSASAFTSGSAWRCWNYVPTSESMTPVARC